MAGTINSISNMFYTELDQKIFIAIIGKSNIA